MTYEAPWMDPKSHPEIKIEMVRLGDCREYGIAFGPSAAELKTTINGERWYIGLAVYALTVNFIICPGESQIMLLCGADEDDDPFGKLSEKGGFRYPIHKFSEYYALKDATYFPMFQALRFIVDHMEEDEIIDPYIETLEGANLEDITVPEIADDDWQIENHDPRFMR